MDATEAIVFTTWLLLTGVIIGSTATVALRDNRQSARRVERAKEREIIENWLVYHHGEDLAGWGEHMRSARFFGCSSHEHHSS
jgi:hypothetical protein